MKNNPLDHSRQLDIWIWSNKPEIRKAADYIFKQLLKKRKPQLEYNFHLKRLKNHLKVILTDLFVAHREDPALYIAFSRDMKNYRAGQRYRKIYLNPRYLALLTDFMAEEGFIELHKGNILIDGKPTVELDYSCLHIAILYALEGITPPEGDLYKVAGISSEHRKIVKKAFNIAINSKDEKSALLAINESRREIEKELGIISPKAKDILFSIRITHYELSKYLCTGYGVYLQRIDSDLAEDIMVSLNLYNICALCIHDSFVVNAEYEDILRKYMVSAFYNKFTVHPCIK